MMFGITRRNTPWGNYVHASGDLDLLSSPILIDALETYEREQPDAQGLWLDLSNVEFIDSSGLTVLIEAQHRAAATGKPLFLVAPHRTVRRMLALVNLEAMFKVIDQLPELLRAADLDPAHTARADDWAPTHATHR